MTSSTQRVPLSTVYTEDWLEELMLIFLFLFKFVLLLCCVNRRHPYSTFTDGEILSCVMFKAQGDLLGISHFAVS